MSEFRVPMSRPQPDVHRFLDVVAGKRQSERPPMVEYIVDAVLLRPIVEDLIGRQWVNPSADVPGSHEAFWDNFIEFWYRMGYDCVRLELGLAFYRDSRITADTAPSAQGRNRNWAETAAGPICSREDYERYNWPVITDEHFATYEYVAEHLPDGMGLLSCHGGGIFEHVSSLFGYETLCLSLYDQPDLVRDVCDRVGGLLLEYHRRLCQIPQVVAIFQGDDMGFRTGTLISAEHLRQYFLPWHKRFAQNAHEHGRPYYLHSCGNVEAVMDELIGDVGIDAKHSFEDAIVPVSEFKRRYGDHIGVLGGVDVDVLGRRSAEEVRAYVRKVIDECHPGGRFALGSGNSIPSYISVENYLTMLDEALA